MSHSPQKKRKPMSEETKNKIAESRRRQNREDIGYMLKHKESCRGNGHKNPLPQKTKDKIGNSVKASKAGMSPYARERQLGGLLFYKGIDFNENHKTHDEQMVDIKAFAKEHAVRENARKIGESMPHSKKKINQTNR